MLEILYVFLLEMLKDTDESNYKALCLEVAIKSILW